MSRLLRAALRAYPAERRRHDGEVLLDCAAELAAGGSSVPREAAGLVAGGLRARVDDRSATVLRAPWGAALDRLPVPLAAALIAWALAGAARHQTLDLGAWWALLLAGAALAFAGALTGRRATAVTGWVLCAVLVAQELLASSGPGFHRWTSTAFGADVDVVAAFAPVLLLGMAAAWRVHAAADPAGLAWLAPALAVGAIAAERTPIVELGAAPAEALLLAGLLATPVLSAVRARRRPVAIARTALLLAVAVPEAGWLVLSAVPVPDSAGGALLSLAAVYGTAALAVLAVARRAGAYDRAG
jgi:hypothetical protein